jgi:hypothetical protein
LLAVYLADLARANSTSTSTGHLRYLDDRAAAAERRFLAACRSLAAVRRLAVPAVVARVHNTQINLGPAPRPALPG